MAAAGPAPLRADSIKIFSQPAFERVTIVDFSSDRVVFRGLSGETLRVALGRVEQVELERAPSFTQAERARIRQDWEAALAQYDKALHDEPPGPLHELMRVRRMEAIDLAGRFESAIAEWLALLESAPSLAQVGLPRHPGKPGSQSNVAARDLLAGAVLKASAASDSTTLPLARRLWLELLIYDEVEPLPAEFRAARPVSQPLLFARTQATSKAELPAESLVFSAAATAMKERDFNRAVRLLEPALPFAAAATAELQRLRLGQARLEIGQFAAAASDLIPLVESGDRDRAAQALYHVALAHERLGRRETARRYYQQALERTELPPDLRAAANAALARIGD